MAKFAIKPWQRLHPQVQPAIYIDGELVDLEIISRKIDSCFGEDALVQVVNATTRHDDRDVFAIIAIETKEDTLIGVQHTTEDWGEQNG